MGSGLVWFGLLSQTKQKICFYCNLCPGAIRRGKVSVVLLWYDGALVRNGVDRAEYGRLKNSKEHRLMKKKRKKKRW